MLERLIKLVKKLFKKAVPPPIIIYYSETGRVLLKTKGNSCYDVWSKDRYTLSPGERKLIFTGLFFEIPEGYEIQVRPRSGLAIKNGITVVNAPGTIDEIYRGELGVILINHGIEPFHINEGDRIAQICLAKCEEHQTKQISKEEFSTNTERGIKGFGSSGV